MKNFAYSSLVLVSFFAHSSTIEYLNPTLGKNIAIQAAWPMCFFGTCFNQENAERKNRITAREFCKYYKQDLESYEIKRKSQGEVKKIFTGSLSESMFVTSTDLKFNERGLDYNTKYRNYIFLLPVSYFSLIKCKISEE
jgi:hypothetical protein